MSFYENFIRFCKGKNESPKKVTESIGISRSAVTGWKKGIVPKGNILVKLAYYFDIPVEYLLSDESNYICIRKSFADYIVKDYIYKKLSDHKLYLINRLKDSLSRDELDKTLNDFDQTSATILLIEEYQNSKNDNDTSSIYYLQNIFISFSELDFVKEDTHETTS